MDVENIDLGTIPIGDCQYEHAALVFAGGGTVAAGTILARVTASGKFTPFVIGGANGAEVPKFVLTEDVVSAGAGDVATAAIKSGQVDQSRLIVNADGDDSNLTPAILDTLRSYGPDATPVGQLSVLDNQ